jgi:hypothetical protein
MRKIVVPALFVFQLVVMSSVLPTIVSAEVLSTVPANAAMGVSVGTVITATFSEDMNPSTIDDTTFLVNDGSTNILGTVTYADMIATFTPETNLSYVMDYTATITTGAEDLGGNPLENPFEWTFSTQEEPDATPPAVSSTSPASGNDDVSAYTAITATFSEDMDPSIIDETTFSVSDGANNIPGTVTYNDTTATFAPTTMLAFSKTYVATITTGVQDLAGNSLDEDYVWSFTTKAGFTLDRYPLNKGSEWVYSMSPSSATLDYLGYTFHMTFGDLKVSIPSDGHRRMETTCSGTVNGYSFSGDMWYEEEYVVDSGRIQLASEHSVITIRIPGEGTTTLTATGTLLAPISLFEAGMEVGDSLPFSGTEQVQITIDDGVPEETEVSISGTTGIMGEQEVAFGNDLVDTIEVHMDSTVDGAPSPRTFYMARFVGPMSMEGAVSGFEEFFEGIDQVTYTLKSTNLPIWDVIDTYTVDSSIDTVLQFNLNGGIAEINIPADCLSDATALTVGDISNPPPSPGVNGMAWGVGIHVDDPNIMLDCPITVTIPYTQKDLDDAQVNDPNKLVVYRWGSPSSGWEPLEVMDVDMDNHTISFEVSELSIFGLGARASGGGGGGGCFIGTAAERFGW